MLSSLYCYLWGEEDISPCPKQSRLKDLLNHQIKNSNLKLKSAKCKTIQDKIKELSRKKKEKKIKSYVKISSVKNLSIP